MSTRQVGVRELRLNLAQTIREVERGETVEVTRDGEPVVRIVPIRHLSKLDQLIAEGRATPARGSLDEFLRTPRPKSTTGISASEALQEDRGT